jgi:hypothetical protein
VVAYIEVKVRDWLIQSLARKRFFSILGGGRERKRK